MIHFYLVFPSLGAITLCIYPRRFQPENKSARPIFIRADVVDSAIPLLVSRPSLRKLAGVIDFKSNTLTTPFFSQQLIVEPSGHIRLDTSQPPTVIHDSQDEHGGPATRDNEILFTTSNSMPLNKDQLKKLHLQFNHCSAHTLTKILRSAKYQFSDY